MFVFYNFHLLWLSCWSETWRTPHGAIRSFLLPGSSYIGFHVKITGAEGIMNRKYLGDFILVQIIKLTGVPKFTSTK